MPITRDTVLTCIPARAIESADDEHGRAYLIKEKTKNRLLKKIIDALRRRQHFHIHLDELGSAVWHQIDGQRTVAEISTALEASLREKISPALGRVTQFIITLHVNGFVRLSPPAPTNGESAS